MVILSQRAAMAVAERTIRARGPLPRGELVDMLEGSTEMPRARAHAAVRAAVDAGRLRAVRDADGRERIEAAR